MTYATPRKPKGSVGGTSIVRLPPSDLDHGDFSKLRPLGRECWGCDQPTFYDTDVWSWRSQKWLCRLCFLAEEGIELDGFKQGFDLAVRMLGQIIDATKASSPFDDGHSNEGWEACADEVIERFQVVIDAVGGTLAAATDDRE